MRKFNIRSLSYSINFIFQYRVFQKNFSNNLATFILDPLEILAIRHALRDELNIIKNCLDK